MAAASAASRPANSAWLRHARHPTSSSSSTWTPPPSTMAPAAAEAAPVPFKFYKVTPLGESQGEIAACGVISLLLVDYFLHSATPTRIGIEGCIREGVALYAQMHRTGAFASGKAITYRPDDAGGEAFVRLGTNYVSPEDAFKAMRQAPWRRLLRITQRDDITGLNIPPITEFRGLQADDTLPSVVDSALHDPSFSTIMKPSLDAGLDALSALAFQLEPGQSIAGALSVGAAAGGHVLALAIYKMADHSVRYHLVETLPCDPTTGRPCGKHGGSVSAAWITSNGDIGIRNYAKEAFPPVNDRDSLLSLYSMQEDGTGGSAFLYSITTFARQPPPPPLSTTSRLTPIRASTVNASAAAASSSSSFSLHVLPQERMDMHY